PADEAPHRAQVGLVRLAGEADLDDRLTAEIGQGAGDARLPGAGRPGDEDRTAEQERGFGELEGVDGVAGEARQQLAPPGAPTQRVRDVQAIVVPQHRRDLVQAGRIDDLATMPVVRAQAHAQPEAAAAVAVHRLGDEYLAPVRQGAN